MRLYALTTQVGLSVIGVKEAHAMRLYGWFHPFDRCRYRPTHRRLYFWQTGQKKVDRVPRRPRWMLPPQLRHGFPSRS